MASAASDVLIVGGGPAGLAAALGLCRAQYTATVFDSGVYRNRLARHMHTVPTWDHKSPEEYRKSAREEMLRRYTTVDFVNTTIQSVRKTDNNAFVATDAQGNEWTGKRLLLATGVTDVLPDIPGYDDCWAKGIFHCLFCHGYEERGAENIGVLAVDDLAVPPMANHLARNAQQFGRNVIVYTNGNEDVANAIKPLVAPKNMTVDSRKIRKLTKMPEGPDVVVELEDGEKKLHGFLVHKPKNVPNVAFAKDLGLELTPSGAEVKTSQPFYATNIKGVYAAGDCGSPLKAVPPGITSGGMASAGIVADLQAD
ncbi:Thioredoxin reductase gliT [Metarhizium anisopliae]